MIYTPDATGDIKGLIVSSYELGIVSQIVGSDSYYFSLRGRLFGTSRKEVGVDVEAVLYRCNRDPKSGFVTFYVRGGRRGSAWFCRKNTPEWLEFDDFIMSDGDDMLTSENFKQATNVSPGKVLVPAPQNEEEVWRPVYTPIDDRFFKRLPDKSLFYAQKEGTMTFDQDFFVPTYNVIFESTSGAKTKEPFVREEVIAAKDVVYGSSFVTGKTYSNGRNSVRIGANSTKSPRWCVCTVKPGVEYNKEMFNGVFIIAQAGIGGAIPTTTASGFYNNRELMKSLGKHFMLVINNELLAYGTSAGLRYGKETIDTANYMSGGWRDELGGIKSWELSGDAHVTLDKDKTSLEKLVEAYKLEQYVTVQFLQVSDDGTYSFADSKMVMADGEAIITSLDVKGETKGILSLSVTLQGCEEPKWRFEE